MTNEEVIEILKTADFPEDYTVEEVQQALNIVFKTLKLFDKLDKIITEQTDVSNNQVERHDIIQTLEKELCNQEPCEDCISRQTVLDTISRIGLYKSGTKEVQAVAECLRAVEALPPVMVTLCDDAISRQIISDYVQSHIQEINTGYGDLNKHTNEILRMIVDYIESMPHVTPQQKIGKWIFTKTIFDKYGCTVECLSCHKKWKTYDEIRWKKENKFCHNCGIKMGVEK